MIFCESCGVNIGKAAAQCPHCRAWQGGALMPGDDNPPSSNAPVSDVPKPAKLPPLSKEERWAREALRSAGFLWGSDLFERLNPSVEREVERLNPKLKRPVWHAVSLGILLVGIFVGLNPRLEVLSLVFGWAWLGSVSLHGYVAYQGWKERDQAKHFTRLHLITCLEIALTEARQKHLSAGPFRDSTGLPPPKFPEGISHEAAEHLCADWMRFLGEADVRVTRVASDGGVDITSSRCVAQVKNYQGSVGVQEVRQLVGAASVDGRYPIFFTSGHYTRPAVEFAEQAAVRLFVYDAKGGTLDAANRFAQDVIDKRDGR